MNKRTISNLLMAAAVICLLPGTSLSGDLTPQIKRPVPIKPVYQTLPQHDNTNEIVFRMGSIQPNHSLSREVSHLPTSLSY